MLFLYLIINFVADVYNNSSTHCVDSEGCASEKIPGSQNSSHISHNEDHCEGSATEENEHLTNTPATQNFRENSDAALKCPSGKYTFLNFRFFFVFFS